MIYRRNRRQQLLPVTVVELCLCRGHDEASDDNGYRADDYTTPTFLYLRRDLWSFLWYKLCFQFMGPTDVRAMPLDCPRNQHGWY